MSIKRRKKSNWNKLQVFFGKNRLGKGAWTIELFNCSSSHVKLHCLGYQKYKRATEAYCFSVPLLAKKSRLTWLRLTNVTKETVQKIIALTQRAPLKEYCCNVLLPKSNLQSVNSSARSSTKFWVSREFEYLNFISNEFESISTLDHWIRVKSSR